MLNKSGAKSYQMDMCTGSILKKMLIFSLPLMASSMLQLLFNAADIIVVGRFAGDNALAAVGSNTALINLLTNFFMGLSIGANVLVARYFGAKNDKDLSETVHTAMMLSIYSGIILTIIGVLCAKQILIWMQTPEAVLGLATPVKSVLCVMAIGAGAMTVSHANDSYFWVVTNFGDMTPEQGYKTQTVCTLIMGIASMVEIFILSLFL